MDYEPGQLWTFLIPGYLLTIVLETIVLLVGLAPRHALSRKVFAGAWLTACTYPIVVLVLPPLVGNTYGYVAYLVVAETFAPAAECALFLTAFGVHGRDSVRDCAAIVVANLVSFLLGGWLIDGFIA